MEEKVCVLGSKCVGWLELRSKRSVEDKNCSSDRPRDVIMESPQRV